MRRLPKSVEEFILMLKDEVSPVIVEGKNDVRSLARFGVESVEVSGSLTGFVERFNSKEVILLMDADPAGEDLVRKLKKLFSDVGVRVDLFYWRALKDLGVSHVEELTF